MGEGGKEEGGLRENEKVKRHQESLLLRDVGQAFERELLLFSNLD